MRLFFRKEGSGDPLVILHGLYGSSDNWLGIARKLAARWSVFVPDLRNHGHSPHHPDHSYEAMKTDLALFLEEHGIKQPVLIGHSMGGKVAMYYAADYPENVKKLVVADIAPRDYLEDGDESQYHLHRNIFGAMLGLNIQKMKTRSEVGDRLAEQIDSREIIQFLLKNVTTDPQTHRLCWRLHVEALYNNLEEIVGGVNERWLADRIPVTAYPVLFIRGLESNYIREKDIALIRRIYPDACVTGIPGAGHWLHAEQPELFLEAVERFC